MKKIDYKKLSVEEKKLLEEANSALQNSYNPYSKFLVGAALLALNGEVITGANMENASYGACICAERAALARANAMGLRKFSKITLIAKPTLEVTAPCGICRQMLYESSQLSGKDLEVIMANTKMTKIIKATISELLPLAFGPKDLGMKIDRF